MIFLRSPRASDAPALADLWRRSIAELCEADHHGVPQVIAAWCERKTPAHLRADIADATYFWLVATHPDGTLVGVGILSAEGVIHAVYVHPAWVGVGIGSLLLGGLLREAARRGISRVSLESTATARGFYFAHGFRDAGLPALRFGRVRAFPMTREVPRPGALAKPT